MKIWRNAQSFLLEFQPLSLDQTRMVNIISILSSSCKLQLSLFCKTYISIFVCIPKFYNLFIISSIVLIVFCFSYQHLFICRGFINSIDKHDMAVCQVLCVSLFISMFFFFFHPDLRSQIEAQRGCSLTSLEKKVFLQVTSDQTTDKISCKC